MGGSHDGPMDGGLGREIPPLFPLPFPLPLGTHDLELDIVTLLDVDASPPSSGSNSAGLLEVCWMWEGI